MAQLLAKLEGRTGLLLICQTLLMFAWPYLNFGELPTHRSAPSHSTSEVPRPLTWPEPHALHSQMENQWTAREAPETRFGETYLRSSH